MKRYAIIPSGGVGKRLESSLPKQYIQVNGKELIAFTLEIFQNCKLIDEIIIAAQTDFFPLLNKIKSTYNISKLTKIIEGGKERQDSVFNALKVINGNSNDVIAVHDAARPLLSNKILEEALLTANNFDNVIVATKATDTLVSGDEFVKNYIDRNSTYYVQTPQISRYNILMKAMERATSENYVGTDESILLHRASNKIRIVEGSSLNFKITNNSDLDLFKNICNIETIWFTYC